VAPTNTCLLAAAAAAAKEEEPQVDGASIGRQSVSIHQRLLVGRRPMRPTKVLAGHNWNQDHELRADRWADVDGQLAA